MKLRTPRLALLPLLPLLALVLGSTAEAGGVRILEPTGTKSYTTLQDAVDAAQEGDVILVGAGVYKGAIVDGKSLSIHAIPPGAATLDANLSFPYQAPVVRNLAAHQSVTLRGFQVRGQADAPQKPALDVRSCLGTVRVGDCTILAGDWSGSLFGCDTQPGPRGVDVTASGAVVLSGCTIEGGDAGQQSTTLNGCATGKGGVGLRIQTSTVLIERCTVRGGKGEWAKNSPAGVGGAGAHLSSSTLWASASTVVGGAGGNHFFCGAQASGGVGLLVSSGQAHLLQSSVVGGPGGVGAFPNNGAPCQGAIGAATSGAGITAHAGVPRTVVAPERVLGESATWDLTVTAQTGDAVHLMGGRAPGFRLAPLGNGAFLLPTPTPVPLNPWFVNGAPQPPFAVPPVQGGALYRHTYHQGLAFDPAGTGWLGGPLELVAISRTSPPDCNANGVNDFVEVIEGTVPDANGDLKPDGCP